MTEKQRETAIYQNNEIAKVISNTLYPDELMELISIDSKEFKTLTEQLCYICKSAYILGYCRGEQKGARAKRTKKAKK